MDFDGRVEHKDFWGGVCVHSHFMKSECEVCPQFMKSGRGVVRLTV